MLKKINGFQELQRESQLSISGGGTPAGKCCKWSNEVCICRNTGYGCFEISNPVAQCQVPIDY